MDKHTEVIKPHIWTEKEAYSSGKMAFRIGVDLSNNPFSKHLELSKSWIIGWNSSANDERNNSRKPRYYTVPDEEFDERKARGYRDNRQNNQRGPRRQDVRQ